MSKLYNTYNLKNLSPLDLVRDKIINKLKKKIKNLMAIYHYYINTSQKKILI